MSVIVSEVYDALISAGAPEDQARAAAAAIPIQDHLATKQDILKLREEIAAIKAEVAVLKVRDLHVLSDHDRPARQDRVLPRVTRPPRAVRRCAIRVE